MLSCADPIERTRRSHAPPRGMKVRLPSACLRIDDSKPGMHPTHVGVQVGADDRLARDAVCPAGGIVMRFRLNAIPFVSRGGLEPMRLGFTVRSSSMMLRHPREGIERVRGRIDTRSG